MYFLLVLCQRELETYEVVSYGDQKMELYKPFILYNPSECPSSC